MTAMSPYATMKAMTPDKRHGGPYDRGYSDAYYGRNYHPHYYKGNTAMSDYLDVTDMTKAECLEYCKGYYDAKDSGDVKDYGEM